jgi:glyoxylate/hydroxypyruvate reductase A
MRRQDRPRVLIASYLEPELVERIKTKVPDAEIIYRPDLLYKPQYFADHTTMPQRTPEQEKEWRSLLASAEILYDFDNTHLQDLPELAPKLKWIQATSAGIGQFVKEKSYLERTKWIFTTASGVHSRPLGEFVIMAMLLFVKNFFRIQNQKATKTWKKFSGYELRNFTLGIVGVGKIGREVARLAKSFDMRVVGNSRNSPKHNIPHVDELFGPEGLGKVLSQSNFLAICVPHTEETEGMIGPKEIATLPKGAVIINVSRGQVIDELAMIYALDSGHLAGAALDVFAEEPLPLNSPLWSMPNVIISPHSASNSKDENQRLADLFSENLRRYIRGEPLLNVLNTTTLY